MQSISQNDLFDDIKPTYVPITYDDFSDFAIYTDNSLIESTNSNSTMVFDYTGGTSTSISENYVLTFDEYGNCYNFDIRLKFAYSATDLSAMLSFYLYVGSYYDYLGNYLGTDYEDGSQHLCFSGIYDAWSASKGKYYTAAYVNDVHTPYSTSYILAYSGDLTLQLTRNESGLYTSVSDSYTGQIFVEHNWVAGIDKPVNFLMINFRNGNTQTNSHVIAYDFEAELIFNDYPDSVAPYVEITYPSFGQTIFADSTAILWEGNDNESGLLKYYIKIDNDSWIDVGLHTNHIFYNLTYGTHTVSVTAVDNEGNNYTDTIDFFIDIPLPEPDTTKPYLSVLTPINGTVYTSENITAKWYGYDLESGMKYYSIRLDETIWINASLANEYTFHLLSNGSHSLEIQAFDYANNLIKSTSNFYVNLNDPNPDTNNPFALILSPTNGSILESDDISVTWIGYDLESGLSGYSIKLDNQDWQDVALETEHTFYDLSNGSHTVYLKVIDNYLNTYTCRVDFIVNIYDPSYDTIDPIVIILSPVNGSILPTENITATWTGSDAISGIACYFVRLDYGYWFNIDLETTCNFNNLKDGLHTLEVKAIDYYGNEYTDIVTFTISTTTEESPGFTIALTFIALPIIFTSYYVLRRK